MIIAFDCQGTLLDGPGKVLDLFKYFQAKGAYMIVWSSAYGYAMSAKALYGSDIATFKTKVLSFDTDKENFIDIAVDDQENQFLAAKHNILVRDIPENPDDFESHYGHFFK